jgi:hypothetical protein
VTTCRGIENDNFRTLRRPDSIAEIRVSCFCTKVPAVSSYQPAFQVTRYKNVAEGRNPSQIGRSAPLPLPPPRPPPQIPPWSAPCHIPPWPATPRPALARPDPTMAGDARPDLGAPPGQIPPTPGQIPAPRSARPPRLLPRAGVLGARAMKASANSSDPTTVGRQEAGSSSICLDLASDLL